MIRVAASPSVYFFKWMKSGEGGLADGDLRLVNHCILFAVDAENAVTGFTYFEPRSLDHMFFDRLARRIESPDSVGLSFNLIIPSFISHRLGPEVAGKFADRLKVQISSYAQISSRSGKLRIRDRARVVCVDDSPLLLKVLLKSFRSMGSFDVVEQISDPRKAVEAILRLKPDLVTMDIQMPGMTGVDVVRRLKDASFGAPIIMVSSVTLEDGGLVFEALNAGAFEYVQKPSHDEFQDFENELLNKALAGLSGGFGRSSSRFVAPSVSPSAARSSESIVYDSNLVWLIGASTGGTQALTQILTRLPKHIPPTLIVQHIPPVFSKAFASSLNALCPFEVKEAENGDVLKDDCVYIAAGGKQMAIAKSLGQLNIEINDDPAMNRFKPSVDYLLFSAARLAGCKFVAGILTGMGRDGAEGLLALKKQAAVTFAQDEKSSAVFGMPRAAIEVGATVNVLDVSQISEFLVRESHSIKCGS